MGQPDALSLPLASLHPTSVSCLEGLQALAINPAHVLDIGCGSGLLGGFCALRWPQAKVLASDISPKAVADTQALITAQGLAGRMRVLRADMLAHADIAAGAPYDLIICNLLAEPIVAAAEGVRTLAAPGAICLLSGLLAWLAPQVEQAYAAVGFGVQARLVHEPWHTLVLTAS